MAFDLAKLINDEKLPEFVEMDTLMQVLNTEPPKGFVKDHPTASGVKYIPIDKIELLLTKIYQNWYVEIRESKQIMNSVVVTVRLHYKNPISSDWQFQDGIGAVGVQTDKGAAASDMSAIKADGIMKAMPAAESYAVKDAAEKLGKIFGKDINRKDTMSFTPSYGTAEGKAKAGVFKSDDTIKNELKVLNTSKEILEYLGTMSFEEKKLAQPFVDERIQEINDARS